MPNVADRKLITVVVPAHDEESNIPRICDELFAVLDRLDHDTNLLFVDDGSTDGTWTQIHAAREKYPGRIGGIRLSRNFGKEAALLAGIEHADADAVITIDADLQHPAETIEALVSQWEKGYHVVDGVKSKRGREGLVYRLLAMLFYGLVWMFTGQKLKGSSDFKLLDRTAVDALRRYRERRFFYRAAVANLGFRRIEVPFCVAPRAAGRSAYSLRKLLGLVVIALTSSPTAPMRIISTTGMVFLALALALGGVAIYHKIIGVAVAGFTTVILLLLILGGMIMLGLGTLGEYIAATLEEVKDRPRYITESTCLPAADSAAVERLDRRARTPRG